MGPRQSSGCSSRSSRYCSWSRSSLRSSLAAARRARAWTMGWKSNATAGARVFEPIERHDSARRVPGGRGDHVRHRGVGGAYSPQRRGGVHVHRADDQRRQPLARGLCGLSARRGWGGGWLCGAGDRRRRSGGGGGVGNCVGGVPLAQDGQRGRSKPDEGVGPLDDRRTATHHCGHPGFSGPGLCHPGALRALPQGERPVHRHHRARVLAGLLGFLPGRRHRCYRRGRADRLRSQLDRPGRGRLVPDGGLHRRARGGDARCGVLREPHDPALLRGVYAGRPALRLVLRGPEPLYRINARAGSGAEFHRAVCLLGAGGPVFVSPDRALVREASGGEGGAEGVYRDAYRGRGVVYRDHHVLAGDGDYLLRGDLRGGPGRVYQWLLLRNGSGARLRGRHRQERPVPAALVARTYDIFVQSPAAMLVVAYIGGFTALMAATMALTKKDMKRVIAYSTVSQLGYMMLALGIGAFSASIFHLYNHAFFKALLFLGAGSIIYAMNSYNIFDMGGLRRRMPLTFWTMVIAGVSLAGIFPLSGFWSKDAIVVSAFADHFYVLFAVALLTVFLTAFYIFRAIFVAFMGEPRSEAAREAVESPGIMTGPMVILAFFAVVSGLVGTPFRDLFAEIVAPSEFATEALAVEPHEFNVTLAVVSVIVGLAGIALAYALYVPKPERAVALARRFSPMYTFLDNGWYFDALYDRIFVRPAMAIGTFVRQFDRRALGSFVTGIGRGAVGLGERLRPLQGGGAQNYALFILVSVLLLGVIVGAQYAFLTVALIAVVALAAVALGARL